MIFLEEYRGEYPVGFLKYFPKIALEEILLQSDHLEDFVMEFLGFFLEISRDFCEGIRSAI